MHNHKNKHSIIPKYTNRQSSVITHKQTSISQTKLPQTYLHSTYIWQNLEDLLPLLWGLTCSIFIYLSFHNGFIVPANWNISSPYTIPSFGRFCVHLIIHIYVFVYVCLTNYICAFVCVCVSYFRVCLLCVFMWLFVLQHYTHVCVCEQVFVYVMSVCVLCMFYLSCVRVIRVCHC